MKEDELVEFGDKKDRKVRLLEDSEIKEYSFPKRRNKQRIVADTNTFISDSSYSDLMEENLSTGRKVVREIKLRIDKDELDKITT